LANPKHFGLKDGDDWGTASWDLASDMSKTATALEFALEVATWNVPHYMKEGLRWLAAPPPPPAETTIPTTEVADA
jgi:putative ATP-dependent endonuclease of OLD family